MDTKEPAAPLPALHTDDSLFVEMRRALKAHFLITPDDYFLFSDLELKLLPEGVSEHMFFSVVERLIDHQILRKDRKNPAHYVAGVAAPPARRVHHKTSVKENSPSMWIFRVLLEHGFGVPVHTEVIWNRAMVLSDHKFSVRGPTQIPVYVKGLIEEGVMSKSGGRYGISLQLTGKVPNAERYLDVYSAAVQALPEHLRPQGRTAGPSGASDGGGPREASPGIAA